MILNKGNTVKTTLPFTDTGSGNKTVKITILGGDTGFMPLSSCMNISE